MRNPNLIGRRLLSLIPLLTLVLVLSGCGGGSSHGGGGGALTFTVEGFVTLNGQGIAQIDIDGGALGTAVTDQNGHYMFDNAEDGLSYTIAAMEAGFSFTPGSQPVTVTGGNVSDVNFSVDTNPWSTAVPDADFVGSYPLGDIFGTDEDFDELFDYIRSRPLFLNVLTQNPMFDPNMPIVFPKTELLTVAGGLNVPHPVIVTLYDANGAVISMTPAQPGIDAEIALDWRIDGVYGLGLEVVDPNYGTLPAGGVMFWLPPYDVENCQPSAVVLSGGGQDWSSIDVNLSSSVTPVQIQSGATTQFGNIQLMFFNEAGLEVSLASGTQGRVPVDFGEFAKFVSPCDTLPNQLPSSGGWCAVVTDTGYFSRPSTYYFAAGSQNEILVRRPVFQSFTTGMFDQVGIETVFGGVPGDHLGGTMNVVDPFNLTGGQPTPIRTPAPSVGANSGSEFFQSLLSDPRVIGIQFDLDLYDGQNAGNFIQRDSVLIHVERMSWER